MKISDTRLTKKKMFYIIVIVAVSIAVITLATIILINLGRVPEG